MKHLIYSIFLLLILASSVKAQKTTRTGNLIASTSISLAGDKRTSWVQFYNTTGTPSGTLHESDMWYNPSDSTFHVWDGAAWLEVGRPGGGSGGGLQSAAATYASVDSVAIGSDGTVELFEFNFVDAGLIAYEDTVWMDRLTLGQKEAVRRGLFSYDEIPHFPYSVPIPDPIFKYVEDEGIEIQIVESVEGLKAVCDWSSDHYFTPEPYDTIYYISSTGHNDSTGLSPDKAWRTFQYALTQTQAKYVRVMPGEYFYNDVFGGSQSADHSIFFSAFGPAGSVSLIAGYAPVSWVLSAGQTNTYQANFGSSVGMIDRLSAKDAENYFVPLTTRNSIAEVEANAGSWYYDGSTNYVHLANGRVPTGGAGGNTGDLVQIVSSWGAYNAIKIPTATGIVVGLKGFDIYGSPPNMYSTSSTNKLVLNQCRRGNNRLFTNNPGGWQFGSTVATSGRIIQDRCIAKNNGGDGFAYANAGQSDPDIIEFNCVADGNYITSSSSVDGSSTHNDANIFRFGGAYINNGNYGIHDTGDTNNSYSWNIGITVKDQTGYNGTGIDIFTGGSSSSLLTTWSMLINNIGSTSNNQWSVEGSCIGYSLWNYQSNAPALPTQGGITGDASKFKILKR